MTTNENQIRLVIHTEGGVVQAVYTESADPIRIAIMAFDYETGDEVHVCENGTEFIGYAENTLKHPQTVTQVFAALGESTPA